MDELLKQLRLGCTHDLGSEGYRSFRAEFDGTHVVLHQDLRENDSLNNEWSGYLCARVERVLLDKVLQEYLSNGNARASLPSLNSMKSTEKMDCAGGNRATTELSDYVGSVHIGVVQDPELRFWFNPSLPGHEEMKRAKRS